MILVEYIDNGGHRGQYGWMAEALNFIGGIEMLSVPVSLNFMVITMYRLKPCFSNSPGINYNGAGNMYLFKECGGGTLTLKQVTC